MRLYLIKWKEKDKPEFSFTVPIRSLEYARNHTKILKAYKEVYDVKILKCSCVIVKDK